MTGLQSFYDTILNKTLIYIADAQESVRKVHLFYQGLLYFEFLQMLYFTIEVTGDYFSQDSFIGYLVKACSYLQIVGHDSLGYQQIQIMTYFFSFGLMLPILDFVTIFKTKNRFSRMSSILSIHKMLVPLRFLLMRVCTIPVLQIFYLSLKCDKSVHFYKGNKP